MTSYATPSSVQLSRVRLLTNEEERARQCRKLLLVTVVLRLLY